MLKREILSLFVFVIVFATGCTTLKRYRSLTEPGINNKIADIDLFGFRLSGPQTVEKPKSLWDLSADAQSQFIKILHSRYPDNEMFLNSISNEYMKDNSDGSEDNYANRDLRMIFSISRMRDFSGTDPVAGINITPADRIEYLKISLKLVDQFLRFKGWNMYATEYGSIDIADVSYNRTIDLDAQALIDATLSPVSDLVKTTTEKKISGETKASLSRKEDQSIKYRYLKLNGRINNNKIEMEEEGTREIDLTGNIITDVSLGFNTFPVSLMKVTGLKDSLGRYNIPDKLILEYSTVSVPGMQEIKDTIYALLEMDFVYRNVIKGSKTFPEWDDKVKYYSGKVKKQIVLFTAGDYVPEFFCLGSINRERTRDLLKVKSPTGNPYDIKFRTYKEADAFYTWLMQFPGKKETPDKPVLLGDHSIEYQGNDLTYKQIKEDMGLRVLSYYNFQ
jgi:hypothetical protein